MARVTPAREGAAGYTRGACAGRFIRCWLFDAGCWMVPLLAALLLCCGCRKEMWVQPKYKPLDMSEFYPDTMSARPRIPGTVARGEFHTNQSFYTGLDGTNEVTQFPLPVTLAVLKRGQQRYDIYCVPCHGPDGGGNGMIVQRGFPHPPSFHADRLLKAPVGHFYRVIKNGYGVMYPYGTRVGPTDRWCIAAYVRALQLSQHANLKRVPPRVREALEETQP